MRGHDRQSTVQVRSVHGVIGREQEHVGVVDVPPVEGAFVMNVGDMLNRWSNGRLLSTPHRVTNRSGRERYSVPFFFDPHVSTVISPPPSLGEPLFGPLVFGNLLRGELEASYYAHKPDGLRAEQ